MPTIELAAIDAGTRLMEARGVNIFQAHRFAENDAAHIARLAQWADLPTGGYVVDMGSGTGEVARLWQDIRPDLRFCLVNISAYQLGCVPRFCKQHCCDMGAVPEPDNRFDAAICCFAIGHTEQSDSFREMVRLVRPGGVVFVYDMIRLRGDNARMAELSYSVGAREAMEDAAAANGLRLDVYMEPSPETGWGARVMGEDYETFFGDVPPALWRFIVR